MSPFSWLIMGHLVGDFLFQNRWMAERKRYDLLALALHSLIYTVAVGLFSLGFGGLSISQVLVLFLSHFFLDKRFFVEWWTKNITDSSETWISIVVDQTFHLLVLVLIVHI